VNAREAMQAFRVGLQRWIPYIRRCTHATDVVVQMKDNDVVVSLMIGTVPYVRTFTSQSVYGPITPRGVQARQKLCRFADDIILGALEAYKESKKPT
jgi:hypothetical protein